MKKTVKSLKSIVIPKSERAPELTRAEKIANYTKVLAAQEQALAGLKYSQPGYEQDVVEWRGRASKFVMEQMELAVVRCKELIAEMEAEIERMKNRLKNPENF
jgi:hypothetical protein